MYGGLPSVPKAVALGPVHEHAAMPAARTKPSASAVLACPGSGVAVVMGDQGLSDALGLSATQDHHGDLR
jgi:hypothetical protein